MNSALTTLEKIRSPIMFYGHSPVAPETTAVPFDANVIGSADLVHLIAPYCVVDVEPLSIPRSLPSTNKLTDYIRVGGASETLQGVDLKNIYQALADATLPTTTVRISADLNLIRTRVAAEAALAVASWRQVSKSEQPGMLLGKDWPENDAVTSPVCWTEGDAVACPEQSHEWQTAFQTLANLTRLPVDWDGRGAIPVDSETARAAEALLRPLSAGVPAPSFMPGPNGDVWAIWGERGMNIEICFRYPEDISVMIDDAWGEIEDIEGADPDLGQTAVVLERLKQRAVAGG